ncbi:MAG: thiamine-phosphate kinase [Phycisphaerales bacterium]
MREFQLLSHLAALAKADPQPAWLRVPPGDDMALVDVPGGRLLVAVDQVVEGRHFVLGTPLEAVGRKAVLRNVSDVAAMASVPLACLASVALPASMDEQGALALLAGVRSAAAAWQCPLIGGDTSVHAQPGSPLVLSVTILAVPGPSGRVVTRQGTRAGDAVCVTGALGGSLQPDGSGRHLDFTPRVAAALELVSVLGDRLHAMLDISDGLGRDAAHLARNAAPSALDLELRAAAIPCTAGCTWQHALRDGEDHELLFTCAGTPPSQVAGVPVTVIGAAVPPANAGRSTVWLLDGTQRMDATALGWEHASPPGSGHAREGGSGRGAAR